VTIKVGGQSVTYSRSVSIQIWDPTNLSGNANPQPDFARVQITIGGLTAATYTCRPT
jgi:hypothetical protein